mgnify:CR=1 FL=1|jgi:hypothetical protein
MILITESDGFLGLGFAVLLMVISLFKCHNIFWSLLNNTIRTTKLKKIFIIRKKF